jgi:hypothetical protein
MTIKFSKPSKRSDKNAEGRSVSNAKGKGKSVVTGTRKVAPSKKSIKKA